MPNDQNPTAGSAPTFFDPDGDSGLPSSPTTPSIEPPTTSPTTDIESQMESPEPLYAKEHQATTPTLPPPDFSTMRETEPEDQVEDTPPVEPPSFSATPEIEPETTSEIDTSPTIPDKMPETTETPAALPAVQAEEPKVIPLHAQPPKELPKPPQERPATLPSTPDSRPSSIAALILGVLLLVAIAAATFFYMQNRALSQQINVLQSTQAGRELQPSPTPTVEATISATPTPSSSASPSAFTNLSNIISIARQESSSAQMLMITSDNVANPDTASYKYWFRRGPNLQQYFYIQAGITGEPQLYTQATISPDNNIPDLIPAFEAGNLGISDQDAHALAWTQVSATVNNQTPSTVNAKFINSRPSNPEITQNINLWQLTYSFPGRSNIIVQINANTSEIVYDTL